MTRILLLLLMVTILGCSGGGPSGVGGGTPPHAPIQVLASAGDGQVIVTWYNDPAAKSYNIYCATTSGVKKTLGTKISNVTNPFTHTVPNKTTYYYVITAVNDFGESGESSQVSATPIGANNPLTKDATKVADTNATIGGGFYNPNGSTTTAWFEYGISLASATSTTHQGIYAIVGTMDISANLTGLQERTTYHYRIVTQNTAGIFYGDDKTLSTFITPTTIASSAYSGYYSSTLVTDGTSVYWAGVDGASNNTINEISVTGGTITTLASGWGPVAIDTSSVYWVDNAIRKVDKNGGSVITLANVVPNPNGPWYSSIAVDSISVYWKESGGINKVPINGGNVITVASNHDCSKIVLDSTSLYCVASSWMVGESDLIKVDLNGGNVTTLATAVQAFDIAVDSTEVYWAGPGDDPNYCFNADGMLMPSSYGVIKKISKNGGVITTLASTPQYSCSWPYKTAIDSTAVYWLEGGGAYGTIKKVALGGGSVTTLVGGIGASYYSSIAVDSTSVYWTEGGSIKKAPKSY